MVAFGLSGGQAMAEDVTKGVFIKIEFTVKDERRPEFMEIMTTLNTGMATEQGFISAEVYIDVDHSEKITLIEKWETRKSHEHHYQVIVDNGSWQGILDMLTENPKMRYVREIQVN